MHAFVPLAFAGGWRESPGSEPLDLGSSAFLRALAAEECGYGDPSLFIALPGPALAACVVRALGTREQQERFFTPFLGSSLRWSALAISEPDAGSDVTAMTTRAVRDDGGYVLTGRKWFIGCGARADVVVVLATTNPKLGQFGIRPFLVERGDPGFIVGGVLPSLGMRAVQLSELVFDACHVPTRNVLVHGEGGRHRGGFKSCLWTFQQYRPTVAALAIGHARRCLDLARQFLVGRSRRSVDADAGRIVRLEGRLRAVRLLCWKAAWLFDHDRDNTFEAAMAKCISATLGIDAASECWRLASGAADTSLAAKLLRDAKAFDLLEGTGDIQRVNAIRALIARSRPAIDQRSPRTA